MIIYCRAEADAGFGEGVCQWPVDGSPPAESMGRASVGELRSKAPSENWDLAAEPPEAEYLY